MIPETMVNQPSRGNHYEAIAEPVRLGGGSALVVHPSP